MLSFLRYMEGHSFPTLECMESMTDRKVLFWQEKQNCYWLIDESRRAKMAAYCYCTSQSGARRTVW